MTCARSGWLALALVPALLGTGSVAHARPAPIIAWTYTVRPGDTLAAIAARMGVPAADLARANHVAPDDRLAPGTVLKRPDPPGIPRSKTPRKKPAHEAAPRKTATPAARHTARAIPPPERPAKILPAMPEPVAARPLAGTPHLVWPTSGAVVTRFGAATRKGPDNGIDLAAFSGMTVRAAAAGRVIFAGTEPERFGQLIVIDHGQGWATAYAYLGKVLIRTGATVRAGSVIAHVGASGEVKKPTLHFELRHDNVPTDPLPALPARL